MVLLGPPAAQHGMELEREAARRSLDALSLTIDSNAALLEAHGEARDRLAATLEASQNEDEVLALAAQLADLSQSIERSLDTQWREAVIESRAVAEPARLTEVRRRIGEWAAWKAGEGWAGFLDEDQQRFDAYDALYRRHLVDENGVVYPAARTIIRDEALRAMSADMMARRGVPDGALLQAARADMKKEQTGG